MPEKDANAAEVPQGDTPFANRAPNAKDKGLFWVKDDGTAVTLYVRSKKSGTWFAI